MKIATITKMFTRTINNCNYYEENNMTKSLLNEIGCLRGIAYCMEEMGLCPHNFPDFLRLIKKQQELLEAEKVAHEVERFYKLQEK